MKNNLIICRVDQTFGSTNFFTPIISSKKNKKNEFILTNLESNKNVSNSTMTTTNVKIVEFDSSKMFPNEIRYMGQFFIKNTKLAEHDKMYLAELYKWKYGWKNPVMEGFEYCMSDRGNHVILLYLVRQDVESRSDGDMNMSFNDDDGTIQLFTDIGNEIDETDNGVDTIAEYGDLLHNFLVTNDSINNRELFKNRIGELDIEAGLNISFTDMMDYLSLSQLYVNFFQEIILSSNNPNRALFYSNIFDEDHKKLGFLYKYATNTLNMNPDDLSINQLLQLLNVSTTGDFQTFLDEEFNNQEEIGTTLDRIESIIQNTYISNNSVDYGNFLYEIDFQIFSKVSNLYKVIQSMSNEYIEEVLQEITEGNVIEPGREEEIVESFITNRQIIFSERILSNRFTDDNSAQLENPSLEIYNFIVEHIKKFFNENPYIQEFKDLPVVFTTITEFDNYTAQISQYIQQDRDAFFNSLLADSSGEMREEITKALQADEDDIVTIIGDDDLYR